MRKCDTDVMTRVLITHDSYILKHLSTSHLTILLSLAYLCSRYHSWHSPQHSQAQHSESWWIQEEFTSSQQQTLFKRLNFWHWRRVWCKNSAFLDYICQTDVIARLMQRLKVKVKKQEKHACLGAFVCVSLTSICVGKLWQTVSSNVCVGLSLHISTSSRSMSPLIRSPLATRPILITPHNKPPPLDSL